MMWKLKGRAALLTCASLVLGLGVSSCGTNTIGYLYATSVQYGQVLSFRLNINNGRIGGTNCSVANGGQQTCNNSSGGANPTKMVLASGNNFLYVLNEGSTTPASAGNVGLLTLGGSGSVYSTGQTYSSAQAGQNPIDLVLAPNGSYLYVLYQYQPAPANGGTVAACANPTPTTCPGAIGLYAIGGSGNLTLQPNTQFPTLYYFPVGYLPNLPGADTTYQILGPGGNHFYAASGNLYVLDNRSDAPLQPEVNSFAINANNAQLTNNQNVATYNPYFVAPVAITGSGTDVFIADAGNGAIWTYAIGSSNGALTGAGNGYFCPANPTYVYVSGGEPTQQTCSVPSTGSVEYAVFDALTISTGGSNVYLYAADNNTNQIYSMTVGSTGAGILSLSSGGPNPVSLGTNPTCMVVSTSTPFLYVSGNGLIAGEQINTNTGVLTTQNNTTTSAAVQGFAPCLMFSSRK